MTPPKSRRLPGPALTIKKPPQKGPWVKPALLPGDPVIPAGVTVQKCPGVKLRHEDVHVPIGGFYTDWLSKLRGGRGSRS